jgi:phosphoribosylformimino-5-aminoimidazole carboxamide ribotide isomerase
MRIIPVLDIKAGQVVRGIAGRRAEYRPIVSQITSSTLPVDVAEAFRTHYRLTELYIADLDAIAGEPPALRIYEKLMARGFTLWVDAGVREAAMATPLAEVGLAGVVLGLETVHGPEVIEAVCAQLRLDRIIFSLDLKDGQPLAGPGWLGEDSWSIARRVIELGVERLIVLDLARVGISSGTGTETLCRRLTASHPDVEITAGGGVRDQADIDRLEQCGVKSVLVASALHDGSLRLNPP